MKRGVFLNLKILLVLLFVVALPFLIMLGAGLMGEFLGCAMSGASMPDGLCGTLYTILMVVGWTSIGIVPLTVGAMLLYAAGVIVFFIGSMVVAGLRRTTLSPTIKGMGISTLVILVLAGLIGGGVLAVNWVQTDYVSRCEGLPEIAATGKQNGPLALGVKVPAGSEIEAYTVLAVTPGGELIFQLDKSYRGREPSWSTDGMQLAFAAQHWQTKLSTLHFADLQGNVGPALLADQTHVGDISWSPDGTHLLFEGISDEKAGELFFIKTDDNRTLPSSGRRQLTASKGMDSDPRLSPDGRQIVYASYRNGARDIHVMDSDGSNSRRLTRHAADDINPAWSPDGRWIVFASNRNSNRAMTNVYHLYIMAADGSNQCQLTQGEPSAWEPVWSPDGQWIAYTSWLQSELYLIRPNGQDGRTLPLPVSVDAVYTVDWAQAR
ncbi:MAG: PD40 domain-containing protein [Caldilineaceae bacterium]|nr:PD40 domain-containing protein [Caldilineaceae bacterium]